MPRPQYGGALDPSLAMPPSPTWRCSDPLLRGARGCLLPQCGFTAMWHLHTPHPVPCSEPAQGEIGRLGGGSQGGDRDWCSVSMVVTLSLLPAGPFLPTEGVCRTASRWLHPVSGARPPVLPLLCHHHLPVPGPAHPHRECRIPMAGMGDALRGGSRMGPLISRDNARGRGDAPEHEAGQAGNDAQGWKKLPFPLAGGRKVRDGFGSSELCRGRALC